MLLSEHVYYVAVTFKMTEQVEQWTCIKFCVKLEHSSVETIGLIQRPPLWTMGDGQLHHDNVPTHASRLVQFFGQNIKSPRWLSPATAQIWCPMISGFPQNEIHLWKRRDFRPLMRFRKIRWGSWWQLGELCEVQGAYLEGDWDIIAICTMFLISCTFFNKCLFFIEHGWIPSGQKYI